MKKNVNVMEVWSVARKFFNEKKKSKTDLNKALTALQKLYLVDDELTNGRRWDVDCYFTNYIWNTTVIDVETVKKFNKFFEAIKRLDEDDHFRCFGVKVNFDILDQNKKNVKKAGITIKYC